VEKFLIINPFGIGDIIFTTPVIGALKEKYPDSFIGYWCNERVEGLLKKDPRIDKIFALSRGDIKRIYKGNLLRKFFVLFDLINKIRKERFGIAFDFSLDSRYGLWSKLAQVKQRIGFNYKGRGRFLTDKVNLSGYSNRHIVEYYSELLKFIGAESKNKSLNLLIGKEVKSYECGSSVVGIVSGGGESWGKEAVYKQWPPQKFGQLAEKIISEKGMHVVLLGSANEKKLADTIIAEVKSDNLADLTGRLSLEELAAAIKRLKLLICNDGGPLHMAVALGVSTVSIFGPVDEKVYGPYPSNEKHIVVKKDLSCRPCYENFRFKGCFNNRRCLEDITVDEVYEKVKSLL